LERLRELTPPLQRLAPGHGRVMTHIGDVVASLIAHRLARHERVAAALGQAGEASVDELLPQVYDDVTEAQLPVAQFSLWAHLRYLAAQGRATPINTAPADDTITTRWRWNGANEAQPRLTG